MLVRGKEVWQTPSRAVLENFAKLLTLCLVLSVPDIKEKL